MSKREVFVIEINDRRTGKWSASTAAWTKRSSAWLEQRNYWKTHGYKTRVVKYVPAEERAE